MGIYGLQANMLWQDRTGEPVLNLSKSYIALAYYVRKMHD